MNKFSKASQDRLNTCHKDLQLLCNSVLQDMDITILCGTRGQKEQDEAFATGHSKLKYPNSKHNSLPSRAVDVMPYPIDWEDAKNIEKMNELFQQHADKLGIEIRLGKTWGDEDHIELAGR